jgi:dTDP-4-amino-4,6-dideoxygalactose transaminase
MGNKAENLLRKKLNVKYVFLTTSCTHALELALRSCGVGPGDEVICPSFTFPSLGNAIVL